MVREWGWAPLPGGLSRTLLAVGAPFSSLWSTAHQPVLTCWESHQVRLHLLPGISGHPEASLTGIVSSNTLSWRPAVVELSCVGALGTH